MTAGRSQIIAVIKVRMKNRGITQRMMEQLTGLRQSHISDVLNGADSNPTLATLSKLLTALDLGIAAVDERGIPVTPPPSPCTHVEMKSLLSDVVVRISYDGNGKRSVTIEET